METQNLKNSIHTENSTAHIQSLTAHKQVFSGKDRTRRYRSKIKKDKEWSRSVKEKDKLRKRRERNEQKKIQLLDPTELERARERKRQEMQRYRAKVKARKLNNIESINKRAVAQQTYKKRKRCQKQQETKLAEVRKVERRKLAVARTQLWRLKVKLTQKKQTPDEEIPGSVPSPCSHFGSDSSQKRAIQKVRTAMPQTPKKRAEIIMKLAKSPKTAANLVIRGLSFRDDNHSHLMARTVVENMRRRLFEVKPTGGASKEQRLTYAILKSTIAEAPALTKKSSLRGIMSKYFQLRAGIPKVVGDKWWKPKPRKKRKDSVSAEVQKMVADFFLSPEISREVPCKRDALKKDGNLVQKNIMTLTLLEAYKDFKKRHPNMKLGLTTFKKLKPMNVRKVSETNRRTCLCTACSNAALKAEALRAFSTEKMKSQINEDSSLKTLTTATKYNISDASICEYSVFPKLSCLERSCEACRGAIDTYLSPISQEINVQITWRKWESVKISNKDDTVRNIMSCIEKITSISDFIDDLKSEVSSFPAHLFRAKWQHQQLSQCQTMLQEGDVLLTMDFSENYRCCYKDEVQSGYFEQIQVTLHPMMAYYVEGGKLVKHAIIGVSPDTRHVAHLVKVFEDETMELLKKQPAFNNGIRSIHEWTDGAACQYKGRVSFADISSRTDIRFLRNYFETSHGKGVSDGLGSVVKNTCLRAVVSGKVILNNAESVLKFCKEKLGHGAREKSEGELSKWDFVYVSSAPHTRPDADIQTVKGCRKFHSVRSTKSRYKLLTRELTCYCQSCFNASNNAAGNCENTAWVKPWDKRDLTLAKQLPSSSSRGGVGANASVKAASRKTGRQKQKSNAAPGAETTRNPKARTPVTNLGDIRKGIFVLVEVPSQRSGKQTFPAEVMAIDDQNLMVKYWTSKGTKDRWLPPTDGDKVYNIDGNQIVKLLPNPDAKMSGRRVLYYIFNA